MKKTITIIITLILFAGVINFLHAQEKSTALALGLSIGAPALCLMTGYGLPLAVTIAPSAGHFYAGQWGTGLVFTGLRTATIAVAAISTLPYVTGENTGTIIVCLGVLSVITLIEWIMVPSSVQKYNERFQIKPEIDLQDGTYGIGISYSF